MYQWQSRKNSSAEWTNSGQSGAKTKTLSVTTNNGLDGWQFRCIVKDASGNQKISESATLTISPKITKQPANVNATVGYAAKFSVSVTGSGSLTYKWQSRKNASANWAASGLSGADTATLSVTASAGLNGYQFRCVITDAYGNQSISDGATLSIVPIMITTQPKSVSTTAGSTAKFGVIANGTGLTYQWQSRKNSSASWSNSGQSGAKTAYVSVAASAGLNSWQFRCIITDANGNKLESNEATLTVK